MKNDIRLTYPLWMMAFIAVLGVFALGINSPTTEFIHNETKTSISYEVAGFEALLVFGSLLLYLILLIVFSVKVKQYNKNNPQQKISMISIRPPEYLEADEGMTHITRRAVQKVYTFYSWALPALAIIVIIFPLPRLAIIYAILGLAFAQYWIYYAEIRKHFKGAEE
ncbi:hypothetical protein DHX103_14805 [Planococcus sp. X10-3]|uniref:hypothetical protein n=1 Tax=Planococcus sp. X10-3 TaxID=3061240 RepID=UPI003BAFE5F5